MMIGAGIENVGNTYFMNAALQCLFHTPALQSLVSVYEARLQHCKFVEKLFVCNYYVILSKFFHPQIAQGHSTCILCALKSRNKPRKLHIRLLLSTVMEKTFSLFINFSNQAMTPTMFESLYRMGYYTSVVSTDLNVAGIHE